MSAALEALGPLAALIGVWEGESGKDLSPDTDLTEVKSLYRERMRFESIGQVDNHDQTLFALRYSTMAWRIGADDPFHEDCGYWLWEAAAGEVSRCFAVPRGITVVASGPATATAREFTIAATGEGSEPRIVSSTFLNREFKTVRFEQTLRVLGDDSFSYDMDTVLSMKGKSELFHHRDGNTLHRIE